MKKWESLNKPPVVVALVQLKFKGGNVILNDFLKYDHSIRIKLPIRRDNIQVGLDLGSSSIPLGISKISATSDAKVESYFYLSTDQHVKLEISSNSITYINEQKYKGWTEFKNDAIEMFMIVSELLSRMEIIRTSIRFINRFSFSEFSNPQEYFNTLISSSGEKELPFPLSQYGFRLLMEVPDSEMYSVVNQNVESMPPSSFIYTFDIDVLDRQLLIFDENTLSLSMEKLREIKNTIFFNNVTSKTLELCN